MQIDKSIDDTDNPCCLVDVRTRLDDCTSFDDCHANILNKFYCKNSGKGGVCKGLREIYKIYEDLPEVCTVNGANSINVQDPPDEICFEDSLSDEEAYSKLTAGEGCDRDRDGGDGGDGAGDVLNVSRVPSACGSAACGSAAGSKFAAATATRTGGDDETAKAEKKSSSSFMKKSENECAEMMSSLKKLTESFHQNSLKIFKAQKEKYEKEVKRLSSILEESKRTDPRHKEKEFLVDIVKVFNALLGFNPNCDHFTVHFVAVVSKSDKSATSRRIVRWLILPSTEKVEDFLKKQAKNNNIVFSSDHGLFNAPTSFQGSFKTLRKSAKAKEKVKYGYVPDKKDWIPAMVTYGLFHRLHRLVCAAAMEYTNVQYFAYTGYNFYATQNHYTGKLIKGEGDKVLHRTKNELVSLNKNIANEVMASGSDDDGAMPLMDERAAHSGEVPAEGAAIGPPQQPPPQQPPPGVQNPPELLPPGPPDVPVPVHEANAGGIDEVMAELNLDTNFLVVFDRVKQLRNGYLCSGGDTPLKDHQICSWSKKSMKTFEDAYKILVAKDEDRERITDLVEKAVNEAERKEVLKAIKTVIVRDMAETYQTEFSEIVPQFENHPSRPAKNFPAAIESMYASFRERFPGSARFFPNIKDVQKWCNESWSAWKNVRIDDLGAENKSENTYDDEKASERPKKKQKTVPPPPQQPHMARRKGQKPAKSICCFVNDVDFPCQTQKTWRDGTVSFDRNPKTLQNRVPDDGPAYPWYEKRAKNCCQPCINKINVEREKKICAFYESGLCTSRAATTAHENGTLPVYNELSYKVTKWFSDWREESKDAKICPSCGGRLTYPCFFAWKRFCPEIAHELKAGKHVFGNIYMSQDKGRKSPWPNTIPERRDPSDMFPHGVPAGAPCCNNCFKFKCWEWKTPAAMEAHFSKMNA